MICSSGIVFDPVVGGRRLTFGFHGIYQGTAVLYDRQTGSLWLHLTGACFAGELEGEVLAPLGTGRHTRWRAWREAHPATEVMAPDPAFRGAYFVRPDAAAGNAFFPPTFQQTIHDRDGRLRPHDLLHGIVVSGEARAYPYRTLEAAGPVVHDDLGGVALVVLFDADGRSAAAYERELDGRRLTLVAHGPRRFLDPATGSVWDMDGVAREGPLAGRALRRVAGLQAEWYGWYANHPDTTLWAP